MHKIPIRKQIYYLYLLNLYFNLLASYDEIEHSCESEKRTLKHKVLQRTASNNFENA